MAKKKEQTLEEFLEEAIVPENKQPYKLPDGWEWVYVGSVTEIVSGGTPSTSVAEYYEGGDIPWITPADLSGYDKMLISRGSRNITINGLKNSSAKIIPKDSVLLSSRAPIGYVAIANNNLCTNQGFKSFIPSPSVLSSYLYWYLIYSKNLIISMSSGTTFLEISKSKVEKIPFALAPYNEQKRIADKLGSMLGKIKEAREKIQEARDTFATRRASILHKAFTGQLTQQWRSMNSYEKEWTQTKFADFCLLQRGFDLPKNSRIDGKYPLVSSSGIIDCHNEAKTQEAVVVVGRSGSVGKVYYVDEPCWPLNTTLYSKNIFNNNPKFVYYFCLYFNFEQFSASTAVPTLNRNNFSDIIISVPPSLEEQKEIVRILDKLLDFEEEAKRLSDLEEHLDLLEKIILNKAFRGELKTSDPSDESASELLQKIVSEQSKEKVFLHMDKNFINSIPSPRRYKMRSLDEIEDKYMFGILTANGKMTPEDLWQKSQLNIDDFYYVLAKEMAEGLIKEIRINDNTEVLLEAL